MRAVTLSYRQGSLFEKKIDLTMFVLNVTVFSSGICLYYTRIVNVLIIITF